MAEISIDTPGFTVHRLKEEHIAGILELMNKEGWYYYDDQELRRYLALEQDCFILLQNKTVVGSIFTTNYSNQAWLGNIVVAEEARGLGLAAKLITGVIDLLQTEKQINTFRLGSVPLAIGLYKKAGFKAEAFTTAQEAELPLALKEEKIDLGNNIQVTRLAAEDLKDVAELDQQYFKSNRLHLLTDLYNDSNKESCLCLKDNGKVAGFLMVRRRQVSKAQGGFAEGPDYAYRLGPCCVQPGYGVNGFKALFQNAIEGVNKEVVTLGGTATIYVVFPRNADKDEIFQDTRELARAMGMDDDMDLDQVFDQHEHIFGAPKSSKNDELWNYMKSLGFHQEYFEQVMCYSPEDAANTQSTQRKTVATQADPEGIFATATPGDKA